MRSGICLVASLRMPGRDDRTSWTPSPKYAKAAALGHSVFCTSVMRLATRLRIAKERNNLDQLFKQILTSKLWILDDWGVVSMPRDVSEEVFDLFDRRKHSSGMILTSNRDIDEWPQVFSDPVLAGAAIDRMFDRAHIAVFKGPSYRMKGRIVLSELTTKNNELSSIDQAVHLYGIRAVQVRGIRQ